jgi:hypothetical protein
LLDEKIDSLKFTGEGGGEGEASLLKTPRTQIILLRQCVRVSGSDAETHTLTLSLVRER